MAQENPEISQIDVGGTIYTFEDTIARENAKNIILPRLIITSDAGSVITVAKGITTVTVTQLTSTTWQCDVTSYGVWAVTSTLNGDIVTKNVSIDGCKIYEVDAGRAKVYGVEWDGSSSPAWSRTDEAVGFTDPSPAINNGTGSSPFDDILPWSGMQIIEDSTAGTLVSIPKYYYKWTKNGSSMKLQIAEKEFKDSFVSPAHADRGDGQGERDVVYIGRYHCDSSYKSTSGVQPINTQTVASFRTNIHNLGSDIWQNDFALFWTIRMLYLVEYANWDSQEKIGYGCGNGSAIANSGLTDAMQYHTGTDAVNRTTFGHTQYRYIEDLWGNVQDGIDGIYFDESSIYCIKNPANFSDSTGGTLIGTRATVSGVATEWNIPDINGFEYALYPSAVTSDSSYSTYDCDYCRYYSLDKTLSSGQGYHQVKEAGLFYLEGGPMDSIYASENDGSRLMKLPNNS